jgi:two-component system NarL family sensor kinase
MMAKHETDTEQLERRNHELSVLNSIAEALSREVDLPRALETALAKVAELLGLQTGWVFLLDEETERSNVAALQNLPPALAKSPHRMKGSCYCLDEYRAGDLEGAANVSVMVCSRLKGLIDGTDGLRYHASIPLFAHGKPLGVLNVASTDWRELAPGDLQLLYTVGDLLSIAVERARLFTQSTQLGATEERNRLAREIHDTLAQGLAAITLQLETADALFDSDPVNLERAQQVVQQALSLTRANLEEARRSVLDLRAAPLQGRTLIEALNTLAEEHAAQGSLHLTFDANGDARTLSIRAETGLYRITQEALTNVIRHAHAKHLTIRLTITRHYVRLTITDDGRGFDPSETPKGRYGLIGINERVKLLGGNLKLSSTPGEGTQLDVTIPRKAKKDKL